MRRSSPHDANTGYGQIRCCARELSRSRFCLYYVLLTCGPRVLRGAACVNRRVGGAAGRPLRTKQERSFRYANIVKVTINYARPPPHALHGAHTPGSRRTRPPVRAYTLYRIVRNTPRPPRPRLPRLPDPVPGIRGTYCIRGRLIRSTGAAPAPLAPYSHLSPRGTIGGRACGVGVPAARGGARSSSSARGAVCGAAPAPAPCPWTVSGTKRSVNARQATLSYRRPTATALTSSPPSCLASRAATTAPTAPPERTSHRPRSLQV